VCVRGNVFGETASTTLLALQPGAGVDVRLTDRVAVRFGGDYRRLLAEAETEFRFMAGAVVRAGKR
jgi:opacity protein-like surface antigen